ACSLLDRSRRHRHLHSFPTRRSSDLAAVEVEERWLATDAGARAGAYGEPRRAPKQRLLLTFLIENGAAPAGILDERLGSWREARSEEHTSELQSLRHLVCRLLLEKKK